MLLTNNLRKLISSYINNVNFCEFHKGSSIQPIDKPGNLHLKNLINKFQILVCWANKRYNDKSRKNLKSGFKVLDIVKSYYGIINIQTSLIKHF